jgi:hypothetical protein
LTIGWLSHKNTIQIGTFLSLVGAALQYVAQDLVMIQLGRIVAGWAVREMMYLRQSTWLIVRIQRCVSCKGCRITDYLGWGGGTDLDDF